MLPMQIIGILNFFGFVNLFLKKINIKVTKDIGNNNIEKMLIVLLSQNFGLNNFIIYKIFNDFRRIK